MRILISLLVFSFLVVSCGSLIGRERPTPTPLTQPTAATADCPVTTTVVSPVHNLQDLLPGCDYPIWFEDNTGYAPDPAYFGAYKTLPWEGVLFLGFGKARPAEFNGSLFARYQADTLTAIYQPSEQGFIDMIRDISLPVIHIPGPDPTDPASEPGGSQWDWGNTYVYTPTTDVITKHRNLPNVIHTWGMASTPEGLYAAVSSHTGDYKTWTGEVFTSTDLGKNWTRIADKNDGVGDYRTYDIIRFNDKLYVTWNDELNDPCGLAESTDGGTVWTRLADFSDKTNCRARLFVYGDQLLTLAAARDGILALQTDGSVVIHIFPDFQVQVWVYNPFAVDSQGRLYLVTADNRILRTSDLENWETLVASDRDFFTLGYWPSLQNIVVADRGLVGRLWLLDPATQPIQQPPAPDPAISLSENDVILQWQGQTGLSYRIYRNSEKPDFTPPLQFLQESMTGTSWTDAGAAAQPGGTYYHVRSENGDSDISGPSRLSGKFTYELTPGSQ